MRFARGAALTASVTVTLAACNPTTLPILKPATPTQLTLFTGAKVTGRVYLASGKRIWMIRGSQLSALTPSDHSYAYPTASADGQVTAAALIGTGHAEIALGGSDFSSLTPLTKPPADVHQASIDIKPSLSSDGKRLAFMSDRGTTADEAIWEGPLLRPYRPRQVTFPPRYTGGDDEPAYSPKATILYFVAWRAEQGLLGTAAIPGGRQVVPATTTEDGVDTMDPTVSGDGTLAMIRRKGGKSDLATAAGLESAPVVLTTFGDVRQPAWSPDGTQVLFISRHSGTFDLWSVPAAGGTPSRLTWGADLDANSRPAWIA